MKPLQNFLNGSLFHLFFVFLCSCHAASIIPTVSVNSAIDLSVEGFVTIFKRSPCLAILCSTDEQCKAKSCVHGCDHEVQHCFDNVFTSTLPFYHPNHRKPFDKNGKEIEQDAKSSPSSSRPKSPKKGHS